MRSANCCCSGVTARQRKNELERLNEQLRKINTSLRKQARAGTLYAPGLTYIPPGEHAAKVDRLMSTQQKVAVAEVIAVLACSVVSIAGCKLCVAGHPTGGPTLGKPCPAQLAQLFKV